MKGLVLTQGQLQKARSRVEVAAGLRLQARRRRRPTDELHQLCALEGFLARLAISAHANQLILKGGALLAAYDVRRPTRDVDLAARAIHADLDHVRDLITEIAAITIDDDLVFDTANATAHSIRDEEQYSGVRVSLTATLSNARLSLHVDVNVGDPIWPAPVTVQVQRLLGGTITVTGYPLPIREVVATEREGDTRAHLVGLVDTPVALLRDTIMGRVMQGLASDIATDPQLSKAFRERGRVSPS